jgi:hypothetical protein
MLIWSYLGCHLELEEPKGENPDPRPQGAVLLKPVPKPKGEKLFPEPKKAKVVLLIINKVVNKVFIFLSSQ